MQRPATAAVIQRFDHLPADEPPPDEDEGPHRDRPSDEEPHPGPDEIREPGEPGPPVKLRADS